MEPGTDPIEVVMRQDQCYGRDRIDYAMWMSTVAAPLVLLSVDQRVILPDEAAIIAETEETERKARADGVVALRTQILSHIRPVEDMAIVASIRDRLGAGGGIIGSTSMTWTLSRLGDGWRIHQIFFEKPRYSLSHGTPSTLPTR